MVSFPGGGEGKRGGGENSGASSMPFSLNPPILTLELLLLKPVQFHFLSPRIVSKFHKTYCWKIFIRKSIAISKLSSK